MSRAFVSEEAEAAKAAQLPDRPISPAPNLVTATGLADMDARLAALQAELVAAGSEAPERPRLQRDLRYWRARRATARLTSPGDAAEVGFGSSVTIRQGATVVTWRIVGEDEADPAAGTLAWTAPLARALLGAGLGDTVEPGGGRAPVMVVSIQT